MTRVEQSIRDIFHSRVMTKDEKRAALRLLNQRKRIPKRVVPCLKVNDG